MNLTLQRITLDNFKGTKHRELTFGPGLTRVEGRNRSGKSTIADAYFWCLFNKDAHGNAPGTNAFTEKPTGPDGGVMHNLETAVEVAFLVDGQPLILRRCQSETWTKKKGRAEAAFTGNVSSYSINGVELKLTEYKARLATICDEATFQLLAVPGAFTRDGDWKNRRATLMDMAGDDPTAQLLDMDKYQPLQMECGSRGVSIADLRKAVQGSLKLEREQLNQLPARIDENRRNLPTFAEFEVAEAKETLEAQEAELAKVDADLTAARSDDSAARVAREIGDCQREMDTITRQARAQYDLDVQAARQKLTLAQQNAGQLRQALAYATYTVSTLERQQQDLNAKLTALRNDYNAAYTVPVTVEDTCPTCGQALPADKVQEARQKATESKKATLAGIQQRGKATAAELSALEEQLMLARQNKEKAAVEAGAADGMSVIAAHDLETLEAITPPDGSDTEEYKAAAARMQGLMNQAATPATKQLEDLTDKRCQIEEKAAAARATIARYEAGRLTNVRIAELEMQQKQKSEQVARLERLLILLDDFTSDRCARMEEGINDLFPTVRWRLFKANQDGSGVTDDCTCMVRTDTGYVPFQSANTGSRILADVEIVDVLQKHYQRRLPLLLDNAEQLTTRPVFDGQLIAMKAVDCDLTVTTD